MRARFGTAGNPEGFYAAGKKQSKQMPGWLRERGLDAYEYQCGKGVTVGEATARAIGQAAAQAGIALSLHAPYFVNPANPEPDSQAKTAGYVLAACRVARWMGADRVVVHTGAIQKRTRQAALATARECFRTLRHRCDEEGYQDILLCPETMGKINQLGDNFRFVKENMPCKVNSYKGKVFAVEPPTFVELEVTETDPGFKGDTATNVTKPATVETGAEIKVPLFINPGDKIKIDTRTGEYLERAKG